MKTNKNITPEAAKNAIIKSIGKYGWYPLNNYLELRNVILFGEREHDYVWGIDEMVPGKVIEDALKMMGGELVISIRRLVTKKGRPVWRLNILPMGPGYVCGWEHEIMNTGYYSIEDCLNAIETRKDAIVEKAIESNALYITGDEDAVKKVEEMLSGLLWTTLPIDNK